MPKPRNRQKKYDFEGYATKANVQCTDQRVIDPNAFAHMDGKRVPLVWMHGHGDVKNVMGHCDLQVRRDGVYAYGAFNGTDEAAHAQTCLEHGDFDSMSIFANQLRHSGNRVVNGEIREVSLVLAGANPEAKIENLTISHSGGYETESDDEALMSFGSELTHYQNDSIQHADDEDDSDDGLNPENLDVQSIVDGMSPEEQQVLALLVGMAAEGDGDEDDESNDSMAQSLFGDDDYYEGGQTMPGNLFANNVQNSSGQDVNVVEFSHSVFDIVQKGEKTFREALLHTAQEFECSDELFHDATASEGHQYGILNIEVLFPEFELMDKGAPEFVRRNMDWVAPFMARTRKLPFSKVRTRTADLTADTARAKGYIKGDVKEEQFFEVASRETGPKTVYIKQKLDRDDIIDITDFDVVKWLWVEMRFMLDEEIARAAMFGDGRPAMVGGTKNREKIAEDSIRPIWKDDEFYTIRKIIKDDITKADLTDEYLRIQETYEGSGNLVMYTTKTRVNDLLLQRDQMGHRLYKNKAELADAIGVNMIVDCILAEGEHTFSSYEGTKGDKKLKLHSLILDPYDYAFGSTAGGQITSFDDFDIDVNQYKYLLETRLSGALWKPKSAMALCYEVKESVEG